jgi:hypothetical protein
MGYRRIEGEISWRDFELYCENIIKEWFPEDKFRIAAQHSRVYIDGKTRRFDFHIAERRVGGCGFVVDCKHFPVSNLRKNEIDTTLDYKKACKASKAIILVSSQSKGIREFKRLCDDNDVLLHVVGVGRIHEMKRMLHKILSRTSNPFNI